MTAPDSRTRRSRTPETVIDLRQAAADRRPGPGAAVPPPTDVDLAGGDQALLDAVTGLGGEALLEGLLQVGGHAGSLQQRRLVEDAESSLPRLQTHDASGAPAERVLVHPSWSQMQGDGAEAGLGGRPWTSTQPHARLARAAGLLLWAQTAGSSALALSTHHAATAAVAGTPAASSWLQRLAPRTAAPAPRRDRRSDGRGAVTAGVAVTERGSSAPGSLSGTTATPDLGGPVEGGPTWRVSGRKWLVGNADADVLMVTAATADGPGTFLVPRPGDRSVRTERLRYGSAHPAWPVGDLVLDRAWGVRLDASSSGATGGERQPLCALEAARTLDGAVLAAASLRASVRLAGSHARHRVVPGGPLDTLPLVRTVLADLAVESEAATLLALRLAAAGDDPGDAALLRLAGPVAAAWLSRRAPLAALEARELLGALAFDGSSEMARVHAQSGAVLAGRTGHGLAAEVVRVISADAAAVEAYLAECTRPAGASRQLDRAVAASAELLRAAAAEARQDLGAVQGAARWLVERLAATLQGALVVHGAPAPVAEVFLASRLDPVGVRGLGTLPIGSRQATLVVDRALGDA